MAALIDRPASQLASEDVAIAQHARECDSCRELLRADRWLQRASSPEPRPVALPRALASALCELKPTRTRAASRSWLLLFGAWAACLGLALALAPRPDLGLSLGARLWLPLFAQLALFALGLGLLRQRGRDGLGVLPAARWLAVFLGLITFHALVALQTQLFAGAAFPGIPPRDCLLLAVCSGAAVGGAGVWLARHSVLRGAGATGALLGASAGFASLALLHVHCPSENALHLHTAHGLPLLLLIIAGIPIGRRWLAV
jgi:hypothetical protein